MPRKRYTVRIVDRSGEELVSVDVDNFRVDFSNENDDETACIIAVKKPSPETSTKPC